MEEQKEEVKKRTTKPKTTEANKSKTKTTTKSTKATTAKKETTRKSTKKDESEKPVVKKKSENKTAEVKSEVSKKANTKAKKENDDKIDVTKTKTNKATKSNNKKDAPSKNRATKKLEEEIKVDSIKENKGKEKKKESKSQILVNVNDEEEIFQEETIDVEENIEEIGKALKKKKKLPNNEKTKINKRYLPNIFVAILVVLYFILVNIGFTKIREDIFITDLKVFGIVALAIAIVLFECAYKRKSRYLTIYGIESLLVSIITISFIYIILKFSDKFMLITASIALVFAIYYVVKSIILGKMSKNDYFKNRMKAIIEKDEEN